MNLLAVKNFIAERKLVNMALLLQQFGGKREEMQLLLELLIRKGYVRSCLKKPACGTQCFKCQQELITFYQWVETMEAAV